jgi:hypothetical protein
MKSLKFLLILFVIVLIAVVVVIYVKNSSTNKQMIQETSQENQLEEKNWESYDFPEVGLTLSAPFEMSVRGEKLDDSTFTLYVERGKYSEGDDYYQLYGLYNLSTAEAKMEDLKSGFIDESVVETTVGGFPAVSGQNRGERNRFVTYVITDRGLFMLATSQPTVQNKELTDEILSTFQLN